MKRLSLKEIQKIELDILLEFKKICDKNNLRYYLSGGTLLGAIRHQGFIPWDDDIDLAMPRKDYEKLIALLSDIKDSRFKLVYKSNDGCIQPYAKFVDSKTKIDSKYASDDMLQHLWIDIMPMDGLPEDNNEVKVIYQKAEFYRRIIKLCNAKLGEGKNKARILAKFFLKPIAMLYGKNRAINSLNKLAMQYDYENSKYVGAVSCGLYGVGERMFKAELENTNIVYFEGYEFPSFGCWDSYLTGLYKNYMQLPPEDKRVNHEMLAWIENE